MRKNVTLITGAAGEVGSSLVEKLINKSTEHLVTVDLGTIPCANKKRHTHIQGDILDDSLLEQLDTDYELETIFHLAAVLSTKAEASPEIAHFVNVEGTRKLLQLASQQSQWRDKAVRFLFPSSIAVYGLPTIETKKQYSLIREWDWLSPTTMYGCNKLYCELLGRYLSRHYKQLSEDKFRKIDFRCVRFPGLISALTLPTGGTSDYAPEMLHAAAKGEPYHCFVAPDVRIPFMAMPDAVNSLLELAKAPMASLTQHVYNVTSFSMSAAEIREIVISAFPKAHIDFQPDQRRQAILETWPEDIDDSKASQDWNWSPQYDQHRAFNQYLIPHIRKRYSE